MNHADYFLRRLFGNLAWGLGGPHSHTSVIPHEEQKPVPAEVSPEAQAAAEAAAKAQKGEQRHREDARATVEILFHLHRHELGDRFPKEDFDDYVKRYMADTFEATYVEERAKQLRELIQEHVRRLKPADEYTPAQLQKARAAVQASYDEHPGIHAVFPPRRFQAELEVRIPDTVTAEKAWKQARGLMNEILKLDTDEKEKQCPKESPAFNPPLKNI